MLHREQEIIIGHFKYFSHSVIIRRICALDREHAIQIRVEVNLGQLPLPVQKLPDTNDELSRLRLLDLLIFLAVEVL